MITRKQIELAQISGGQDSMHVRTDSIMRLITDERNQYQELVEAATWLNNVRNGEPQQVGDTGKAARAVIHAVQPFIKLSLSEKITKLSALANEELRGSYILTLKELAKEAKTLEQERELMKYR